MVYLVTRAPLRATRRQVHELRGVLPELARLDIDLLELALDMIPVCVLAWRTPEQAQAIVRELADLEIHALDIHGLHRAQLNCSVQADSLIEASFVPTFHPCALIRATTSRSRPGIDLQMWTAREPTDSLPLASQMSHGLDLDHFRGIEVVHSTGSLDDRSSTALLDALAALRAHRDPEPAPGEGRDGMDVQLRIHDERGAALTIERWGPEPDEAPRVHATLLALLDACARCRLPVADLRRYL